MAVTTTTFTVYAQSYTRASDGQIIFSYNLTWKAFFQAMAAANIGWTLTVVEDTLTAEGSGTYTVRMTHTPSGIYFTATATSSNALYIRTIYDSDGRVLTTAQNYYWDLNIPSTIGAQITYYVDSIGTHIQEARLSQGESLRMWGIIDGELPDGSACPMPVSSGYYAGPNKAFYGDSASLSQYADQTNKPETSNISGPYFTVKAGGQYVLCRAYWYFSNKTNGVVVTVGGKKLWSTGYALVPKAVYIINNVRYIALTESRLIEE